MMRACVGMYCITLEYLLLVFRIAFLAEDPAEKRLFFPQLSVDADFGDQVGREAGIAWL